MKYLAILLLCLGCSAEYGRSYNLYIDQSFSADAQTEIEKAANQWTEKTGVHFYFDHSPCAQARGEFNICIANSSAAAIKDVCNGDVLACTHRNQWEGDSFIYIPKDGKYGPSDPHFTNNVLHELGHALGAEHSRSMDDVMYRNNTDVVKLSDNDAKQLLVERNGVAQ